MPDPTSPSTPFSTGSPSSDSSTLLGRDEELIGLRRRLAQGARLVTVTGAGGIGKTKLARAVVTDPADRWATCDLSEVKEGDGLLAAIATAAGVSLAAPDVQAVARLLEESSARVLLDDFDSLVRSSASIVDELLALAPAARFVVTSREPLRVEGEVIFEVPPLADAPARELFEMRARALRSDLPDDEDTLAAVSDIVAACDGLPLAVELLAARVLVLSPLEIARRARESLEVFGDARAHRPTRHQSLRAAIQSSWDLLDDAGRSTLCQLGAFAGGFTVDAVEAVMVREASGPSTLDVLSELQAVSLVARDPHASDSTTTRLRLLDTISSFVREVGDADTLRRARDAHRDHFAAQAVSWAAAPTRSANAAQRAEVENVRAAVAHALAGDDPAALPLSCALSLHTQRCGPFAEGLRALRACSGLANRCPPLVRARWLLRLAETMQDDGQLDEAFALGARCWDLCDDVMVNDAVGDDLATAREIAALARVLQTHTLLVLGRSVEAQATLEDALTLAASPYPRCAVLDEAGAAAIVRGEFTAAEVLLEEALALATQAGANLLRCDVLAHLGVANHRGGDFDRAARWLAKAAEANEQARDLQTADEIATGRWLVALARGRFDEAFEQLAEVERSARQIGTPTGLARAQGDRGLTLLARGDDLQARDQLVHAVAVIEEAGTLRMAANYASFLACAHAFGGEVERARLALARARALSDAVVPRELAALLEIAVDACAAPEAGDAERRRLAQDCAARLQRWQEERPAAVSAALTATAVRLVQRAVALLAPGAVLEVEDGGVRFRVPPADWVDLTTRLAPRLVLWALVDNHRASPDERRTVAELFAAGWPGETAAESSRRNRVQVAVSTLRSAGLKDAVDGGRAGYRLREGLVVRLVDSA